MDNNKGLNISAKSFVLAIIIIFLLMAVTYALTFIIPGGEYARIIDDKGNWRFFCDCRMGPNARPDCC